MKKRQIQYNLINNSLNAFISAIEIHNKPNIRYRYESTVVLIINSWELILKAFIRKYVKKSIFLPDGKTITFYECLKLFETYINENHLNSEYYVIIKNLELINEYRNNITHFYNETSMEPIIFSLLTKNCVGYCNFMKNFFNVNPVDLENIFIMPIGFKLPFNPIDYLKKETSSKSEISNTMKEFLNHIVLSDQELENQKITDSVLVQYNLNLVSVKKQETSDLVVGISNNDVGIPQIGLEKKVKIVNDDSAQKVFLSDEDYIVNFPYDFNKLVQKCKETIPNFKQNNEFYAIKRNIDSNLLFSKERKLYPDRKNSTSTIRYNEEALKEFQRIYKENS